MVRTDLGMVTAYAYAKSQGYSGTEIEFAEDLVNAANIYPADDTLAISGKAADAKTTGDVINALKINCNLNIAKRPVGIYGKNIFDKAGDHNAILSGYYAHYQDGIPAKLNNYSLTVFSVNYNEKYVLNSANVHICFYADYDFREYISGLLSDSNDYAFVIPENVKMMALSILDAKFDTFMLQKGTKLTPVYYPFKFGLSGADIVDDSLVKAVIGKNLFDYTGVYTDIITGYYRPYTDGGWGAVSHFNTATFYNIPENTSYAFNIANSHICFYSDDYATEYISGFLTNNVNGYTFTTPPGTKTMCISYDHSGGEIAQLEVGSETTTYEHYKHGISARDIVEGGGVLHVGATREYTTIQSAINSASDGDTIYIDPGVYEEAVDMVGKHVHLIGSGSDATVIRVSGDDYYYPPLEASNGLIENMGFVTTATEKGESAIGASYCVHIDYDNEENGSLSFKNCNFVNNIHHCVGIGLRNEFTVNFTNCKFKSSVAPIYCHEQQANNKIGQRIELIDCSINSTENNFAILLQESVAYSGNEMTILMQRCIAKTPQAGDIVIKGITYPNQGTPTGENYLNLTGWYLDEMSALNNKEILNY